MNEVELKRERVESDVERNIQAFSNYIHLQNNVKRMHDLNPFLNVQNGEDLRYAKKDFGNLKIGLESELGIGLKKNVEKDKSSQNIWSPHKGHINRKASNRHVAFNYSIKGILSDINDGGEGGGVGDGRDDGARNGGINDEINGEKDIKSERNFKIGQDLKSDCDSTTDNLRVSGFIDRIQSEDDDEDVNVDDDDYDDEVGIDNDDDDDDKQ